MGSSSCWPTSKGFAGLLKGSDVDNSLAWFLIAFAIFNTYMLLWSTRVNWAVTGVFLTLEITEILLAIGFFRVAHGYSPYVLHAGGWAGIVTAAVAWYELPLAARPEAPLPGRVEG